MSDSIRYIPCGMIRRLPNNTPRRGDHTPHRTPLLSLKRLSVQHKDIAQHLHAMQPQQFQPIYVVISPHPHIALSTREAVAPRCLAANRKLVRDPLRSSAPTRFPLPSPST